MKLRSKRYKKEATGLPTEPIGLQAAVEKIKSFKSTKFDQTVRVRVLAGHRPQAGGAVRARGDLASSRDRQAEPRDCLLRRGRGGGGQEGRRHRGRRATT